MKATRTLSSTERVTCWLKALRHMPQADATGRCHRQMPQAKTQLSHQETVRGGKDEAKYTELAKYTMQSCNTEVN